MLRPFAFWVDDYIRQQREAVKQDKPAPSYDDENAPKHHV